MQQTVLKHPLAPIPKEYDNSCVNVEYDVPLDLFLPKPSLSTTSSAHCIHPRVLGAGPVARRRRTGVGFCLCVCVVVEAAECVCEACWWDGGAIVVELGGEVVQGRRTL